MSILLNDDFSGGEFYIETCGSAELWGKNSDSFTIKGGADYSTAWYRQLPRTRWVCQQTKKTALLYGSQLTHGTNPVISGHVKKIIGFATNAVRSDEASF